MGHREGVVIGCLLWGIEPFWYENNWNDFLVQFLSLPQAVLIPELLEW